MNLQKIRDYINKNQISSLFEIKEEFHLSDNQLNVIIPFISQMGIKIDRANMKDCDSCSIKKYCTKKSCKIKGDLNG